MRVAPQWQTDFAKVEFVIKRSEAGGIRRSKFDVLTKSNFDGLWWRTKQVDFGRHRARLRQHGALAIRVRSDGQADGGGSGWDDPRVLTLATAGSSTQGCDHTTDA